jgi:hypothetical protein
MSLIQIDFLQNARVHKTTSTHPQSGSRTDQKMVGLELDFSPMLLSGGFTENY